MEPQEIQPYEDFLFTESEREHGPPITNIEERGQRILSSLSLDHLDEEGYQSIEALVRDYPFTFWLDGDPAPCTPLV